MTFNRNDFLDWAQNAKTNPANTQYQDHAKQFVNPVTNPDTAAINSILDGGKNIIGKDNNSFRDAVRQVEEGKYIHPKQKVVGGETPYIARGHDSGTDKTTVATKIPPKYADSTTPIRTLKPTANQLGTAIKKRKENMENPVMIVKGRDNMGGHVQQKKITGQDMENAAGERRKEKIAKNTTPMGKGKSLVGRIFGKK